MFHQTLKVIAVVMTLASTSCVMAHPIRTLHPVTQSDGTVKFAEWDDSPAPALGNDRLWDCWTPPESGGSSRIRGSIVAGTLEIGERCIGVPRRGGLLSDVAFGIANLSTTQSITQMRITSRVYDTEGRLLFTSSVFSELLPPAPPGEEFRFSYGDGAFLQYNVLIPDNVVITFQIAELGSFNPADLGFLVGSPITAGTGDGAYYNRSTNQNIALPSPDQNLLMYVHTLAIPSPSSASLLAALSLLALRRRRLKAEC